MALAGGTIASPEYDPEDVMKTLAPLALLIATSASAAVIDFEQPSLGAADRAEHNPYLDAATGTLFTVEEECSAFVHVLGLSKNTGKGTSSCVPPASSNQVLAL